jgi:hypothetical protein
MADSAESAAPNPTAVLTAAQQQIMALLNQIVEAVSGFIEADLSAAIADAQAQTPPDALGIACWQTIAKIPPTAIPAGAGVAYLKQRFRDLQMLYVPINQNCAAIAPEFTKLYNQAMTAASSLTI